MVSTKGKKSAIYKNSLISRQLDLQEFIEWWQTRETLAKEGLESEQKKLDSLNESVCQFLDTCTQLRVISEPKKTLQIEKAGIWLDVRQLSDGERGLLAMVIDLTRRLAEANPKLADPAKEGQAVVLIDELDLHLHPKWQRRVVSQLIETFPKCQFIATTHSPQIIGSVKPENIIVIKPGEQPFRPDQSLGMDTNWLLEYLMETDERDSEYEARLTKIQNLIEGEDYETAQQFIDALRSEIGEFTELVRLQTRLDRLSLLNE